MRPLCAGNHKLKTSGHHAGQIWVFCCLVNGGTAGREWGQKENKMRWPASSRFRVTFSLCVHVFVIASFSFLFLRSLFRKNAGLMLTCSLMNRV